MRRAPLIILSFILIAASVVASEVSFNAAAVQLPLGYSIMLTESIILVDHTGHPAITAPLNMIGFGLAFVLMAFHIVAMLVKHFRPRRGFAVESRSTH